MIFTLLTLAVSLPAAPAPAPRVERPEAGKLPPRVVWITAARDGKFFLADTTTEFVPVQKTKIVPRGGQQIQVVVTEMEARTKIVQQNLNVENVNFYSLEGKKLDSKQLRKLLTKDMPALLSADGKPVDRFYLQLAREGTLVLVVPPAAAAPREETQPAPVRKLPPEGKK